MASPLSFVSARENVSPPTHNVENGVLNPGSDGGENSPLVPRDILQDTSASNSAPAQVAEEIGETMEVEDDGEHNLTDITAERLSNLEAEVNMEEVNQEAEEQGDTDSVMSTEEAELFSSAATESANEKLQVMIKLEDDAGANVLDCMSNGILIDLSDDVLERSRLSSSLGWIWICGFEWTDMEVPDYLLKS